MSTGKNKDIPEDVVIDILTRLPVKSLVRLKSVCKSWCGLFRNPDFITQHHLKQTHLSNSDFTVLVKHVTHYEDNFYFISSSGRDGDEEVLPLKDSVYMPFTKDFMHNPLVLGPCNGLVCICGDEGKISLWNPAIREFKPLPLSPIERPSTLFGNIGFGFDRKANDYKILRFVTNYFVDVDEGISSVDQVEIYSLKNDSWREIQCFDVFPPFIPWFNQYHDGVCYWLAYDNNDDELILSFDFADEVFDKMPLPDFGVSWVYYGPDLAIFNGMLAVIVYNKEGPEKLFDIWVMTERGVKESWAKRESIGPIPGVEGPLGFLRNGGLFLEDLKGRMVLYDPSSQQLKNLNLRLNGSLEVVDYVESLVPINGRCEDEDEPFVRIRKNLNLVEQQGLRNY